jgi:hypothetical protein
VTANAWAIIATIAVFGFGNGGLFLYKFGELNARVSILQERLQRHGATLGQVAERISRVEGELRTFER